MDTTDLKKLAEGMKGWDTLTECWPCDENSTDWQVGALDEDHNRYPVMTIDTEDYGCEEDAQKVAQYYAAANPIAVLALIAEIDRLKAELECARGDMLQANRIMERDMKDAERYRYARSRSGMKAVGLLDEPVPEGVSHGHDLWIDSRMELEAASAKFS